MSEILLNFMSYIQMALLPDKLDIVDVLSLFVAIFSLVISIFAINRSRWEAARDFLLQVDSEEMRAARKIVYTYYDPEKNNIIDDDVFEDAITRVIAFYDGNARLTLEGYIPKKLFDNTTLFTAAKFYIIACEYIAKRREDDEKSDKNNIYAINYAKLLASRYARRKIKKIMSLDKAANRTYDLAYDNTMLCKLEEEKRMLKKNRK